MKRIWFIILGDFIAFCISFFIIIAVRFKPDLYSEAINTHIISFTILFFSWLLIFFIFGLYNLFKLKPILVNVERYTIAIITCFAIGILLFYFVPIFGIAPKTNLILELILFGIFSLYFRKLIYGILSKNIIRPLIIVGNNKYLDKLYEIIKSNPQIGLNIISYTSLEKGVIEQNMNIKNLLFIFENIPNISEENMTILYKNNSEIIDTAKAYEKYLQMIPVDYIDQKWILNNIYAKKDITYGIARKIIDIIVALTLIIVLSPFLLLAIVCRLIEDGRPIFIKQKRVGQNGKIFSLYKIRSMVAMFPSGLAETDDKPKWAIRDDPRITKVGKILRKTHIDEITQMINILKGDMTLVGPRPEHPQFVSQLENTIPYYKLRHMIKPGFTGWAQIRYRYARTENDSKEKFEYDMYYIKNQNIFLDVGILLKTIQIIFTH